MRVLYAAAAAAVYNIRIMCQNTQVQGLKKFQKVFAIVYKQLCGRILLLCE